MADKFEQILNDCIDRINGGDTVTSCVASYPAYADDLEPMLEAMFDTKAAFVPVVTAQARNRAKQRMLAAVRQTEVKKTRAGFAFPSILRNARVLATAALVLVIALASYFGIVFTSTQIVPVIANAEGNFSLLISDDYARTGVPMLPVVKGEETTRRSIVAYAAVLVAFTLVPFATGMFAGVYLAAAVVLGAAFIGLAVRLLRHPSRRAALRLYLSSLAYLALLFAAMAIDRLVAI